jgi:hypothetical protein
MGSLAVQVKVTARQSIGWQKKMRKKKDKRIGTDRILRGERNEVVAAGKAEIGGKSDRGNFKINFISKKNP